MNTESTDARPLAPGTTFVVEQAGCESCAVLIREVLEDVTSIDDVAIDEREDIAIVRLAPGAAMTEADADRLLVEASSGTGHAYRVRPGSWHVER